MKLSSLPDRRAEPDPDGSAVSDARLRLTSAQLSDRVQSSSHPLGELRIGSVDLVALRPIIDRVLPIRRDVGCAGLRRKRARRRQGGRDDERCW